MLLYSVLYVLDAHELTGLWTNTQTTFRNRLSLQRSWARLFEGICRNRIRSSLGRATSKGQWETLAMSCMFAIFVSMDQGDDAAWEFFATAVK